MSGRGLAAFAAGFGTGMLSSMKAKDEKERQDRLDKANEEDRQLRNQEMADRRAEHQEQKQRESDAVSGMNDAAKMKVGELRNQDGVIDNSEDAWKSRLQTPDAQGNVIDDATIAQVAPIYAEQAKQKGAEKWLSSDKPDALLGQVSATSQGDISRAKGAAIAKLGITGLPQADAYNKEADKADINDKKMAILSPDSTFADIQGIYKNFPDGRELNGEVDPKTGRFMAYTTGADGKHQLVPFGQNGFADLNEFKQATASYLDNNADAVAASWDKIRAEKKAEDALAYSKGRDVIGDQFKRDTLDQSAKQHAATIGIEREKIKAAAAKGNDTAALKFINDSADSVAQKSAEILDAGGRAKFTMGKDKFATTSIDPLTNTTVMSKPKYNTGAKLNQHARALVAAGVPEADAVALLTDRKTIDGKDQYANFGSAKVLVDGKEVTKQGMIYKGKLIPLD